MTISKRLEPGYNGLSQWAILCGTSHREATPLPDAYGPFDDSSEAADYLFEHRQVCPATEQAWLNDHDVADEAHDIVPLFL